MCLPNVEKKLTPQKMEDVYSSQTGHRCSLRKRKDATKDSEAQESYSILISTSYARARHDTQISSNDMVPQSWITMSQNI